MYRNYPTPPELICLEYYKNLYFFTEIFIFSYHLSPWADEHFGENYWCFQQKSAPVYKAWQTHDWLEEHCPVFISKDDWSTNSPDLNIFDYSFWNYFG
jgi:hypothetical protein